MTRTLDHHGVEGRLHDKCADFPPPPAAVLASSPNPISPFTPGKWDTTNLPWRVTSDMTAAACSAGLISPLITIIDRSIIARASHQTPLLTTLKTSLHTLLTTPKIFLLSKPHLIITTVYFTTFLTANLVDTLTSLLHSTPASTSSPTLEKFLATSAVNMSGSLYKDSQFTKMFGNSNNGSGRKCLPKASYTLFALRDSLTVFASFNLPPLLAPLLPLSKGVEQVVSRTNVAQFLAPAGVQLLSTPLHLWGLDLYNRPPGTAAARGFFPFGGGVGGGWVVGGGRVVGWRERVGRVGRDWVGSSVARMGRVVPAFGVGGVVNRRVRGGMLGGD